MKNVLITGVSTGIGRACAMGLAEKGMRVFGSVRRHQDGAELAARFGDAFTELIFDVTDQGAIVRAGTVVEERVGKEGLSGLVNNAGIAVSGPLAHLSDEILRQQLEVNLLGPLRVTKVFLRLLGGARDSPYPPGRVVNISSMSGRRVYPFLGAYAASKHALEAMSEALRYELSIYGIDVVIIEPANVRTPIFDKQGTETEYANTDYGQAHQRALDAVAARTSRSLPAEVVAEAVYQALSSRSPKQRYTLPRRRIKESVLPRFVYDALVQKRITEQFRKLWEGVE